MYTTNLKVPLMSTSHIATSPLATSAVINQRVLPLNTTLQGTTMPVQGQIRGQSRLEYVPYEKKIIEYQPVERIEYVPYQKKVIQYEQRKRYQQVPVQRTYTDYYAIQHITEYIPQVIPETKIQYVPVERLQNRIQYYPVEKQIIHYPDQLKRSGYRASGYQTYNTNTYQTPITTQQVYTSSPYNNLTTNASNQTFGGNFTTYQSNSNNGGRLLGAPLTYQTTLGNQYSGNITETGKFGGSSPYNGNYRLN